MNNQAVHGGALEILCSRLTTHFDDEVVLSQLNLTVPAGKITCLLGPSGCGKTTLLKHILGLLRPGDGMVHIGRWDVWNSSPQALREMYTNVSSLHSGSWIYSASLYSSLSVRDNLLALLREKEKALATLEGLGRERDIGDSNVGLWVPGRKHEPDTETERELSQRADDCLRRFRLVDAADLLPEELAARTLRRAAVARSLVADASVYILDDPDTASDAPNPGEVVHAILDTHERTGATMLIATHDLTLAELVSDHIAVLSGGRIVVQGDPRDVLDQVDNWYQFNARFPSPETDIGVQDSGVSRSPGGPRSDTAQGSPLLMLLAAAAAITVVILGVLLLIG